MADFVIQTPESWMRDIFTSLWDPSLDQPAHFTDLTFSCSGSWAFIHPNLDQLVVLMGWIYAIIFIDIVLVGSNGITFFIYLLSPIALVSISTKYRCIYRWCC